jgi:hypothetical protein
VKLTASSENQAAIDHLEVTSDDIDADGISQQPEMKPLEAVGGQPPATQTVDLEEAPIGLGWPELGGSMAAAK